MAANVHGTGSGNANEYMDGAGTRPATEHQNTTGPVFTGLPAFLRGARTLDS